MTVENTRGRVVNTHVNRSKSSQEHPITGVEDLRISEALLGAADDVIQAFDLFDLAEINKIDLELHPVKLPSVPHKPEDPVLSQTEQLIYQILVCSDSAAVDNAIREFQAISAEFIVPFSAFSVKLYERVPNTGRTGMVLGSVYTWGKVFDQLLREFVEQRARELWLDLAVTWRRLDLILQEFYYARASAAHVYKGLAWVRIAEEKPPGWLTRSLSVGPIKRRGNTISVNLDRFMAGGIVGLCRRIANLSTANASLRLITKDINQMLLYDQLLNLSGLSWHLSYDEIGPFSKLKSDRNLEELLRAEQQFLKELGTCLWGERDHASYHPPEPSLFAASPPSAIETAERPLPAGPGLEPEPPKNFEIQVHSATHVSVVGCRPLSRTAKRALLALRMIAGEVPGIRITFWRDDAVALIQFSKGSKDPRKIWHRHKKALEKELVGIRFDEDEPRYTVHGLRFVDRLPFKEFESERRQLLQGPTSSPKSKPAAPD